MKYCLERSFQNVARCMAIVYLGGLPASVASAMKTEPEIVFMLYVP